MSRVHSTVRKPSVDAPGNETLPAAQRGDENAFRALYRATQPKLLRYLQVLVGREDAEDVASDAWLHIARDLTNFHGDLDGFRGWATTIARNRAMDHLRRRQRRPVVQDTEEMVDSVAREDTAEAAIDALGTDAALALIARLPRDQAEAVLLRVVVGLDAKAAAAVLGKRPGAVRTAAHRGLRKLQEYLGSPGKTSQE